jgi:uncharacterized BrkB/YihY/UPF0761 family membrane protein
MTLLLSVAHVVATVLVLAVLAALFVVGPLAALAISQRPSPRGAHNRRNIH